MLLSGKRIDGDSALIRSFCENEVKGPGKFEGCARYTVFYYDCLLSGEGEEEQDGWVRFDVRPEDVRMFPELSEIKYVDLFEDGNGFIYDSIS